MPRFQPAIQLVLFTWAALAAGPIGADWLTAVGVGESTAVAVAAAAPVAGLLAGYLFWRLGGRHGTWRASAPDWGAILPLAIGMTGLVSGTASRGHLFVLIFLTVPAVIVLLVVAVELRVAGNRSRHPDVVEVTTDLGGLT